MKKTNLLYPLVLILILASCKKEYELDQNKPRLSNSISTSTITHDSAYYFNNTLSTPQQYIAARIRTQNSGEETVVYTTFTPGRIDSLYILLSKKNRAMVQTMYANGNQVYFKNIHDTVGKVNVDLDGNTGSGVNIPIRTIFTPEGNGYSSGAVFNLTLYSMRIAGTTYRDSVPSFEYKVVGSKPQISLEKATAFVNDQSNVLAVIDLRAIADFVVIEDIPIVAHLRNATIDGTTLHVIDDAGRVVGTVSNSTSKKVSFIRIALPYHFKIASDSTTKLYLIGKLNFQPNWHASFALDNPQKFVWDDDTYKVFKGKSNTTYLTNQASGDYSLTEIVYP